MEISTVFDNEYCSKFESLTNLTHGAKWHGRIIKSLDGGTDSILSRIKNAEAKIRCNVIRKDRIAPMKVTGSAEAKVDISWGDKEGPSVSVGISGEVHDNKGNYAKGEITHNDDGKGNASISAGHKETHETNANCQK